MRQLIILILFFCGIKPLLAQSTQADIDVQVLNLFDISLEDILDQDIVSATQEKQSVLDAPAQAYIITREQIHQRGYRYLMDALDDVPQFMVLMNSDPEHRNLVAVRGIVGNEKLLILKDGVRITPATGDFYTFSSNFNILNAERIEVILGPASALYGVDAYSGVVHIITKPESQETHASLRTQYGSFGSQNHAFEAGVGNAEVYFQLAGHMQQSNEPNYPDYYPELYGWYASAFQPHGWVWDNPESGQINLVDQYVYEAGESFHGDPISRAFDLSSQSNSLDVRLHFRNFTFGVNHLYESHSSSYGLDPRYTAYDGQARIKTTQDVIMGSHFFRSFDQTLDVRTTLSFNLYEVDPTSHVVNLNSLYQRGYIYSFSNTARVEQQVNWKPFPKMHLAFGHSYEQHVSLPRSALSPVPYDPTITIGNEQSLYYIGAAGYEPYVYRYTVNGPMDISQVQEVPIIFNDSLLFEQDFYFNRFTNYGAYAQGVLKPAYSLDLILGARYDYNSRYGPTVNPRMGYVWKLAERTNLKMMYGTSFLSPSPSKAFKQSGSFEGLFSTSGTFGEDLGVILFANTYHFPNPDLKPERLKSFDVGFNTFVGSHVSLQFNGFRSSIRNGIDLFAPIAIDLTDDFFTQLATTSINSSDVLIMKGYSLGLNYFAQLGHWQYSVAINYDKVRGKAENALNFNPVPYFPEKAFKATFNARTERLNTYLGMTYRSGLANNPYALFERQTPPYWQVKGTINLKLLEWDEYQAWAILAGYNLLNQRYGHVTQLRDAAIIYTPQDPINWQVGIELRMK